MTPMTLEERLDEIKHTSLDLMGSLEEPLELDPHRPEIKLWAGSDDDRPAHVALALGSLWGQQSRFVTMTSNEARRLAQLLTDMARAVDSVVTSD